MAFSSDPFYALTRFTPWFCRSLLMGLLPLTVFKTHLKLAAETTRPADILGRAPRFALPVDSVRLRPARRLTDVRHRIGGLQRDDRSRPYPNHRKYAQQEHEHRDQAVSYIPEVSVKRHSD